MADERQIQETIARSISIMVYYKNGERTTQTRAGMVAEVRDVARLVAEMKFEPDGVEEHVLRPVEAELLARYGHELGNRLNAEFRGAFEDLGVDRYPRPESVLPVA